MRRVRTGCPDTCPISSYDGGDSKIRGGRAVVERTDPARTQSAHHPPHSRKRRAMAGPLLTDASAPRGGRPCRYGVTAWKR